MNVTTKTFRVTTLEHDALPFDAVLEHEPVEWIDPVVKQNPDKTYTVTYAVHDEYCDFDMEYVLSEGVEFEEFTTEWDRDDYLEATDLKTHVPFIVDHFEHSGHAYTLAHTLEHLGMYYQFDSRPSCVLRVPVDFTDPRAAAVAMLETYTAAVNGDAYMVVRQDFDVDGSPVGDTDVVGGYFGAEQAEEGIREGL